MTGQTTGAEQTTKGWGKEGRQNTMTDNEVMTVGRGSKDGHITSQDLPGGDTAEMGSQATATTRQKNERVRPPDGSRGEDKGARRQVGRQQGARGTSVEGGSRAGGETAAEEKVGAAPQGAIFGKQREKGKWMAPEM